LCAVVLLATRHVRGPPLSPEQGRSSLDTATNSGAATQPHNDSVEPTVTPRKL
jgi:hypothetical protein